jgi:UDP-3-O-[3-hydroxymyristoyl] glucosamine N-acyltransferase
MPCTLAEIADWVAGTVQGDPQLQITGASPLGVTRPGDITLVDNSEKSRKANLGPAVAAIVPRGVSLPGMPTIEVENVHAAFAKIVAYFRPQRAAAQIGRSPKATIHPTAKLADDVEVHAGATIGDDVIIGSGSVIHAGVHIMAGCRIGEQVTIFPGAVLYENTEVGARSIVHAGAVLGAYGFGYKAVDGRHERCAQLGYVQIGEDVEIGANTTIDRGTYGPTVVEEGTKIDNQVMIAHNCRIGRHNMICSQVGIAGSSTTGEYVVIAGQAGVRDHVHIGDRAVLCAMAGIVNDVPPATTMLGAPATPERDQKLAMVAYLKLPEMRRQLRALELAVAQLKQQTDQGDKTAA